MKYVYVFLFLPLFIVAQNVTNEISELIDKATNLQVNQKYKDAHIKFQQALELGQINNQPHLISKINAHLGNFYLITGEINEAKRIFENLDTGKHINDNIRCYLFHRKAFYFNHTLQLDSALFYSNKALKIANTLNLKKNQSTIFNELGNLYEKQGEFKESITYYTKALNLISDTTSYDYSNTIFNLAKAHYNVGNHKKSINYLNKNLANLKGYNWFIIKAQIHEHLALNHFSLGDSLQGYKNNLRSVQFTNEVIKLRYNEEYQQILAESKTKEKDNLLLKQEQINKQQTQIIFGTILILFLSLFGIFKTLKTNKTLKKLSNENNFLLEEVNHRIKNNLQLIVSLLDRETNKFKGSEKVNNLTSIALKIESIATLHQLLYVNEEKKDIDLNVFFSELVMNIEHLLISNQIKLQKNFDNTHLDSNTALYLGLIFNELIFNSIKHAFSNNTDKNITISISKSDKLLQLEYKDNGNGYSGENPKLITLLGKQIKADLTFNTTNGFYLKLKIKL
jgi:two-component sensor histidine kinase/Tfp pilus assembly protein PilF